MTISTGSDPSTNAVQQTSGGAMVRCHENRALRPRTPMVGTNVCALVISTLLALRIYHHLQSRNVLVFPYYTHNVMSGLHKYRYYPDTTFLLIDRHLPPYHLYSYPPGQRSGQWFDQGSGSPFQMGSQASWYCRWSAERGRHENMYLLWWVEAGYIHTFCLDWSRWWYTTHKGVFNGSICCMSYHIKCIVSYPYI